MGSLTEDALSVVQRLRGAGAEAYFAGGCVRDRFLGRPAHEIDIATSASPEEIERLFEDTVPVGKRFGVILVKTADHRFEVATFRRDGTYLDGRRPESVEFAGLKEDVARRDFTINGMMYDPVGDRVLDLVEGRKDLELRVIRAIGNPRARIEEDRLRMLRAVRFACHLGFTIEPETEAAIRSCAPRILDVSAERIAAELRKILLSPGRAAGLELLRRTGLLRAILPEVAALEGVPQPPDHHPEGDVWTHTRLCLEKLEDPPFEVALAALLHDIGKPRTLVIADRIRFNGHAEAGAAMTRDIARRLRLPAAESDRVAWLVGNHMFFTNVPSMRKSTLKRLVSDPRFADLLAVHRADMLGGKGDLSIHGELARARADFEAEPHPAKPFVTGRDLIAMGLSPGPRFKRLLKDVEDARLEGRIRNREEAIAFVRARIPKSREH